MTNVTIFRSIQIPYLCFFIFSTDVDDDDDDDDDRYLSSLAIGLL